MSKKIEGFVLEAEGVADKYFFSTDKLLVMAEYARVHMKGNTPSMHAATLDMGDDVPEIEIIKAASDYLIKDIQDKTNSILKGKSK